MADVADVLCGPVQGDPRNTPLAAHNNPIELDDVSRTSIYAYGTLRNARK